MSDVLYIDAQSPKQLIVIDPTANGSVITSGYQVAIAPLGDGTPPAGSLLWQDPDEDGSDSGILVGTATDNVFLQGDGALTFTKVAAGNQIVIFANAPAVNFT